MSASNWTVCPRCAEVERRAMAAEENRIAAAYGVVPVGEFDRMRHDFAALSEVEDEPTFREDYEIWGARDGIVKVTYKGKCQQCGLSLTFQHEHPIEHANDLPRKDIP